jgi:hypothetical protein
VMLACRARCPQELASCRCQTEGSLRLSPAAAASRRLAPRCLQAADCLKLTTWSRLLQKLKLVACRTAQ